MNVKIRWVGMLYDGETRIWGYLQVDNETRAKTHYFDFAPPVHTFWGTITGRIFFKSGKLDTTFSKNATKKRRKYPAFNDSSFNDRVIEEFNQYRLIKMLKGE